MPSENYTVKYPVKKLPNKVPTPFPNPQIANRVNSLKIEKKKYSTNIDPRSFLTVYEYGLGSNWVIWDYHNGLVFFTGLYKICNEGDKFDYLKVIDKYSEGSMSSVKRIRGGFLKIQGTWIPYRLAYEIASRFAYKYRYQLALLFGESFIKDCAHPQSDVFKNFDNLKVDNKKSILKSTKTLLPSVNMKRRMSLNIDPGQPKRIEKKPRSRSFNNVDSIEHDELQELKDLLNASKQLHNFCNHKAINPSKGDDIFNYAGFTWKFSNNDRNLRVLGKSDNPQKDITVKKMPAIYSTPSIKEPQTLQDKAIQSNTTFPSLPDLSLSPDKNNTSMTADDENYSYTSNATTDMNEIVISNSVIETNTINSNSSTVTEESTVPKSYDGIETILIAASHLKCDKSKIKLLVNCDKDDKKTDEKLTVKAEISLLQVLGLIDEKENVGYDW